MGRLVGIGLVLAVIVVAVLGVRCFLDVFGSGTCFSLGLLVGAVIG